jgi:hypothetical protein
MHVRNGPRGARRRALAGAKAPPGGRQVRQHLAREPQICAKTAMPRLALEVVDEAQ